MYFKVNLKLKKFNIAGLLNALTALFIVLNCQSVWQNSADNNYHIYEICFILIILDTIYTAFYGNNSNQVSLYVAKVILGYLFLVTIIVLLSVSSENLIRFLSRFLIFPFFMIHFNSKAHNKQKLGIFYWFSNWVAFIAWVSFICWLFSTVGMFGETNIINVDWFGAYASFHGIYYSSPYQCIDWIGSGIRRNIGIFTEGPMYMIVLVLALLFISMAAEYYEPKRWKVVGIILALLSVASVTGYAILLFFFGMKMMHKFKNKRTQILLGMIAMIIVVCGVLGLLSLKHDTNSYIARIDDYRTGIKCWLQSPLYGNGYENISLLRNFMSQLRSWNQGFSNTIFSVLAYGGILLAMLYIIPVIRGLYYGTKKDDYKLLQFSLIYLVLYFTVIFYTFYVNFAVWAFLMTVYKQYSLDEGYNNKKNKQNIYN